jgi:hypothetical protein
MPTIIANDIIGVQPMMNSLIQHQVDVFYIIKNDIVYFMYFKYEDIRVFRTDIIEIKIKEYEDDIELCNNTILNNTMIYKTSYDAFIKIKLEVDTSVPFTKYNVLNFLKEA